MSGNYETLIVNMDAPGVQLVLKETEFGITAKVWFGEYPNGKRLTFSPIKHGEETHAYVHVGMAGRPEFWIRGTCFELPWLELLKVADFLQLQIPLPHPLPGGATTDSVHA